MFLLVLTCRFLSRRRALEKAIAPSGLNYSCPELLHSGKPVVLVPTMSHEGDTFPTMFKLIEGLLPEGLQLDGKTGSITGTPSCSGQDDMMSSAVCIRAENLKGYTDCHLVLHVQMHAAPADLRYPQQTALLIVGEHFLLEPTLKAGVPTTQFDILCKLAAGNSYFSGLPAGLHLDASTGIISGVPEVTVERCSVQVRAYNDSGESFFEFQFVILAQQAPAALAYPNLTGDVTLIVGEKCTYVPTFFEGLPRASFFISPQLHRGMSLDEKTGVIAGTPLEEKPRKEFTVLLQNSKGISKFVFNLQVQYQIRPSGLHYTNDQLKGQESFYFVYVVGKAMQPLRPLLTEGNHLSYTVQPPLPGGLNLNPNDGSITGVPDMPKPKLMYTITASNRVGSAQTTVSLATCPSLMACHARNWSTDQVYLWAEQVLVDQVQARINLLGLDGGRLLQLTTEEQLKEALPGVDRMCRMFLLREIEGLIRTQVPSSPVKIKNILIQSRLQKI